MDIIICIHSFSHLRVLEEGEDLDRTGKMNLQVTTNPHFFSLVSTAFLKYLLSGLIRAISSTVIPFILVNSGKAVSVNVSFKTVYLAWCLLHDTLSESLLINKY